jgi:hypothetical protein
MFAILGALVTELISQFERAGTRSVRIQEQEPYQLTHPDLRQQHHSEREQQWRWKAHPAQARAASSPLHLLKDEKTLHDKLTDTKEDGQGHYAYLCTTFRLWQMLNLAIRCTT